MIRRNRKSRIVRTYSNLSGGALTRSPLRSCVRVVVMTFQIFVGGVRVNSDFLTASSAWAGQVSRGMCDRFPNTRYFTSFKI